ncbi:hypothetical protein Tco_0656126 [Tanacetum coccineum]|uniref:Uncharacterized protein n=1 Tax=Tanacetum coccineum TaxID=301880 RepID=A0ABQ4X8A6_9ASTR
MKQILQSKVKQTAETNVEAQILKDLEDLLHLVKTGLVETIDSLVPLDEHFATFQVWGILETDIQENEQKESQKQTNPSTGWKGQSQKSSQMKKIQLEGLKLPNLKLYYKRYQVEGL